MDRVVTPIIMFRAPRRAFTVSRARDLDKVQRSMIRCLLRVKPLSNDSAASYKMRVAKLVASVQLRNGSWSRIWSERLVGWAGHLTRNTLGTCWPARLMTVRNNAELAVRRATFSQRPCTRARPGWCPRRWTESLNGASLHLDKANLRQHRHMLQHPGFRAKVSKYAAQSHEEREQFLCAF